MTLREVLKMNMLLNRETVINGVQYELEGEKVYAYADANLNVDVIILLAGTEIIDDYAFIWCSSLTNIAIPDSVTSIGVCAFRCCTSLTSITIPKCVTRIGNFAFSDCTLLECIKIPYKYKGDEKRLGFTEAAKIDYY